MKVVIIGGVAGGATAAARASKLEEKAENTIFWRCGGRRHCGGKAAQTG